MEKKKNTSRPIRSRISLASDDITRLSANHRAAREREGLLRRNDKGGRGMDERDKGRSEERERGRGE